MVSPFHPECRGPRQCTRQPPVQFRRGPGPRGKPFQGTTTVLTQRGPQNEPPFAQAQPQTEFSGRSDEVGPNQDHARSNRCQQAGRERAISGIHRAAEGWSLTKGQWERLRWAKAFRFDEEYLVEQPAPGPVKGGRSRSTCPSSQATRKVDVPRAAPCVTHVAAAAGPVPPRAPRFCKSRIQRQQDCSWSGSAGGVT